MDSRSTRPAQPLRHAAGASFAVRSTTATLSRAVRWPSLVIDPMASPLFGLFNAVTVGGLSPVHCRRVAGGSSRMRRSHWDQVSVPALLRDFHRDLHHCLRIMSGSSGGH